MVDHLSLVGPRDGLRDELLRWPAPVRAELERRAASLRRRAEGTVLDLDDPAARALVHRLGSASPSAAAGDAEPAAADTADEAAIGCYDVVLSVAALVELADLPAAIRGIGAVLQPDGEFLFIEPVARPGWVGLATASAGSVLGPVREQHLGRDVPLAIRATDFIITDIERFTMPSPLWPLRPFVHGRAMRFGEVRR